MSTSGTTWNSVKASLSIGTAVDCIIESHHPFGMLVALSNGAMGVIERIGMQHVGYDCPQDYPPVGSRIAGRVLGFRDHNQQVELALLPKLQADGTKYVEVGLHIDPSGKISYFGIELANHAVESGWRVVRVEEGGALFHKGKVSEDSVSIRLGGVSIRLYFEEF